MESFMRQSDLEITADLEELSWDEKNRLLRLLCNNLYPTDDARAYQRHLLKEYYETGYWPGHGESGDDDVQINEEPQMNRIDEDSQEENGDDE
ncbi:hypothetical protein AK812_SmicGene7713 [Symbiodinium microadriaticum]|nr:hypothetical protein AK812_SmicGene14826 [Symbiodinium microadriaticum]OLQ08749.1 hypothetical protein AK812_SmicGene7713 [Symbiodinium microadriaticum]